MLDSITEFVPAEKEASACLGPQGDGMITLTCLEEAMQGAWQSFTSALISRRRTSPSAGALEMCWLMCPLMRLDCRPYAVCTCPHRPRF